jgi:hypothetical protein
MNRSKLQPVTRALATARVRGITRQQIATIIDAAHLAGTDTVFGFLGEAERLSIETGLSLVAIVAATRPRSQRRSRSRIESTAFVN